MLRASIAAIALLVLLVSPGFAATRVVGYSAGDSLVYAYDINTVIATEVGGQWVNVTTTVANQFTLDVLSVDTSAPVGEIGFRETLTIFNATTLGNPGVAKNTTAIFDPYDNDSYLALAGFYPFTYSNLATGSATDLEVDVPLAGGPGLNSSGTVPASVNTTVTRSPGVILVKCVVKSDPKETPWHMGWRYNATTGLLINGTIEAAFFQTPRVLTYRLLGQSHSTPLDLSFAPYVAIAAAVLLVVYAAVKGKSRQEKKAERMRRRFRP
ncbi:MAG: hypothetical protein ABSB26_00645 [Nitrososphaerales archaeon]